MDQQPQSSTQERGVDRTGFRWSSVWYSLLMGLAGLTLLDASIETPLGRASIAIRISAPSLAVVFFVFLALFWKRIGLASKALASVVALLVLIAGTTWLPGGLNEGIAVARQPTSFVLQAISVLAVLGAGISFLRLRAPVWLRCIGFALAAYGSAAYFLAILMCQPFVSLFQGQSFWNHLPVWAQGAWIGAVLIPVAILCDFISFLVARNRPRSPLAWKVDVSLAIVAVALAAAGGSRNASATLHQPQTASRFSSSKSTLDLVRYAVSGDTLTDTDLALDKNGGAIELINGVLRKGRNEDIPTSSCGGVHKCFSTRRKRLMPRRLRARNRRGRGNPESHTASWCSQSLRLALTEGLFQVGPGT